MSEDSSIGFADQPRMGVPVILAMDPSFTAWGWAILEVHNDGDELIDCGTIRTKPGTKKTGLRVADDDLRRVQELFTELEVIWERYQPIGIVAEVPGGTKSARASRCIGMTEGILGSFVKANNAPTEFYTAGEAKTAATGKRNASKEQIQIAMFKLYPLIKIPKTNIEKEAVCDALSVFIASKIGNIYRGARRMK